MTPTFICIISIRYNTCILNTANRQSGWMDSLKSYFPSILTWELYMFWVNIEALLTKQGHLVISAVHGFWKKSPLADLIFFKEYIGTWSCPLITREKHKIIKNAAKYKSCPKFMKKRMNKEPRWRTMSNSSGKLVCFL